MFSVTVAVLSGAGAGAGARAGGGSRGFGHAAGVAVPGSDGAGCRYGVVAAAVAVWLRRDLALGRGG
jgi:hypothetical protein